MAPAAVSTPIVLSATRVLLIEDDHDDAILIADLLGEAKRTHFSLEVAETVAKGKKALQKNRFDILLLDYHLPDGDGLTFLKELEGNFRLPIVLVTSSGDRNLQVRAMEAGAADYLEKGCLTAEVLERTCLYAIGLKQTNSGPELGLLIERLVAQTKESARAHAETSQALKDFRKEFDERIVDVRQESRERHETIVADHAALTTEVQHLANFRWLLDWAVLHPVAAVLIFFGFITIAVLFVFLLQSIDPGVLQKILDIWRVADLGGTTLWIS